MSRRFEEAGAVESLVWYLRLADYPRGKNRELIDRVFNGRPPYTEKDVDTNGIRTNLNDLSAARYAADARRSLSRALENSETYFKVSCDYGPDWKRPAHSAIITKALNKTLKNCQRYWETLESQMALKVIHGIGPVFWFDRDGWCPSAIGIQDVLIPSRTLRSMENLDHFAIYRQLTYEQLRRKTTGPNVDPAWQMDVVEGSLNWVKSQTTAFLQSYAQWYAPQNIEDIAKESMGYMGSDAIPTIDVWDFYYHSDEGGREGWRRRMILDTPMSSEVTPASVMPAKNKYDMDHGKWIYKPSDDRVYADHLSEILHFQFGDATATAPFRYHSVRSLGWLLYPFCHLQNRLRSKFIDHLFENLNQYFRTSTKEDHERLVKLDLHNWGEIPESTQFVKQDERWQINQPLVEMAFTQNRSLMDEAAAQYREGRETERPTERETATAVMARVNAANALVGSLLASMYKAQKFQYIEICRRFCNPKSGDPDVRAFRAEVMRQGVPPDALDVERWEISPDRVLGSGNKMLEVAMADKLMAVRPLVDPESQREIISDYILANSDNPSKAIRLSGIGRNQVSDATIKAMSLVPTLMLGIQIPPKQGDNAEEMITALLHSMASIVALKKQFGPAMADIVGLQNVGNTINGYIALLAQDEQQGDKAAQFATDLKQLMAEVQNMGKELAKAQQEQQGGNGGIAPQDMIKAETAKMMGQIKMDNTQRAHSQKTAQRQVTFEMKEKQNDDKHQLEMQREQNRIQMEAASNALKLEQEAQRGTVKRINEAQEKTAE